MREFERPGFIVALIMGPFEENADPTFGYQTSHTPAQLYRAGIRGVDAYAMKAGGKTFAQLSNGEQDELLSGLEKGEVKLEGMNGKTFWSAIGGNAGGSFLRNSCQYLTLARRQPLMDFGTAATLVFHLTQLRPKEFEPSSTLRCRWLIDRIQFDDLVIPNAMRFFESP